jgi:hypothetical protein
MSQNWHGNYSVGSRGERSVIALLAKNFFTRSCK